MIRLGFRRSTRKRLRRCEHGPLIVERRGFDTAIQVECSDCHASVTLSPLASKIDFHLPDIPWFRSLLPERIAR